MQRRCLNKLPIFIGNFFFKLVQFFETQSFSKLLFWAIWNNCRVNNYWVATSKYKLSTYYLNGILRSLYQIFSKKVRILSKVHVSISRTNNFQTWKEIECKNFLLWKCEYAKCQLPSKQSRGKSANKAQMLLLSSCQSAEKVKRA